MEEISVTHSREILDIHGKIRNAQKKSWSCVMIPIGHEKSISNEWLTQYIKKDYICAGYYWYFECEKDATLFILRWK